jgi:hypothetical protein
MYWNELRRKENNMENRRKLAIADLCRGFLHVQGFLTDSENEKVYQRIMKWQDKNEVGITDAQLLSADFIYDDNAKEED